jgi:hypothetical protein
VTAAVVEPVVRLSVVKGVGAVVEPVLRLLVVRGVDAVVGPVLRLLEAWVLQFLMWEGRGLMWAVLVVSPLGGRSGPVVAT